MREIFELRVLYPCVSVFVGAVLGAPFAAPLGIGTFGRVGGEEGDTKPIVQPLRPQQFQKFPPMLGPKHMRSLASCP